MVDKSDDKLEDIAGSGVPITIKGKEYKLGIFNMRDLADFRQYIKGQRIKIIQESITDGVERIELINNIIESNIDENKELITMDGICFMLWRSLQKYQPNITLEKADALVNLSNYNEISNAMMKIGGQIKNPPKRARKK